MKRMEIEPTIGDVLEAVNTFAEKTERRFDGLETRLTGVENRLTGVENRLTGVENRLTGVESTMVTKAYLDDKLGRVDGKINALINVLHTKNVITTDDKRIVLA